MRFPHSSGQGVCIGEGLGGLAGGALAADGADILVADGVADLDVTVAAFIVAAVIGSLLHLLGRHAQELGQEVVGLKAAGLAVRRRVHVAAVDGFLDMRMRHGDVLDGVVGAVAKEGRETRVTQSRGTRHGVFPSYPPRAELRGGVTLFIAL